MSADVETYENKKFKNLADRHYYNGYANAKIELNNMNRQNTNTNTTNTIQAIATNNFFSNDLTKSPSSVSKHKSTLDYQQQIDLFKKYTQIKKAPSQTIDHEELNNRLSLIINDKGMPTIVFEKKKKQSTTTTTNNNNNMDTGAVANEKTQSQTNLTQSKKQHQSLFSLTKTNKSSKEQINNTNKNSTDGAPTRHFSNSPAKSSSNTSNERGRANTTSIVASPPTSAKNSDGKPPKPGSKERAKSNSFIKRLSFRFKSHSTESTDQTGEFDNQNKQQQIVNNKNANLKKSDSKTIKNQSSIDLDNDNSDFTSTFNTNKNFKPNAKATSQILYTSSNDQSNKDAWNRQQQLPPPATQQQAHSHQFLNNSNLNSQSYNSEQEINYLNIDTMKKVFNVFDRDHDGSITIEDVQEVMNSLSYLKNELEMPSIEQIKIAFEKFDENKNGSIEFNEFLNILKSAAAQNATELDVGDQDDSILHSVSLNASASAAPNDNKLNSTSTSAAAAASYSYTPSNEFKSNQIINEQSVTTSSHGAAEYKTMANNNTNTNNTNNNNEIYDLNQFNNDFSELVRANMKLIFEQFDKDNDGRITRHELSFVMCNLFPDENISPQDIDEMLHAADLDKNGFIDFEEFANMFNLYKKNSANGNIERIDEQTANPYYRQSIATIHSNNTRVQPERVDRREKAVTSRQASRSNSKENSSNSKQASKSSAVSSPQPSNYRKVVQIFTTSQLMDLKAAFTMFDKNGDQKISESELLQVMEYLGLKTTEKEVKAMIQVVDKNRNGYVDYDEFIQMMTQTNIKPLTAEEELKKTFDIFDIDRNGFICADEIKATMLNLGENLTDDEVRDMIKAADKNGDGKIDLNEFSGLLSGASIFHNK